MKDLKIVYKPAILEFDESKWRSSPVLEVDEDDLAVLVEQVVDVLAPDIWGQVPNIDATLVASS